MIAAAAAKSWGVEAASLTTGAGKVHHAPTGRSAPYAASRARPPGRPPPIPPRWC
jgi:isoquinoline 1-oxidoreductase beta subunit